MGQKVNPHGFRVGIIKDWDSRWYEKDEKFGETLVSDYKIRKALKTQLQLAGVPKIEIERDKNRLRVFIHCAKPGMVIGRGGSEIDKLRLTVEKIANVPVTVNVMEIKKPDLNAQLVAENIASQLERRISFRRAMKQSISRTMKEGAKGIKIAVGGRLGGAEIARTEHYHEGTIPLQTLRADIDYGFWEANTTYGKIGVKVWIYKGEILSGARKDRTVTVPEPKSERSDRRERRQRDGNREGGGRDGYRGGNRSDGNRNDGNRSGGNRNGQSGGFKPRGNTFGRPDQGSAPRQGGGNRAFAGNRPQQSYNQSQSNQSNKESDNREVQSDVDAEKS